MRSVSELLKNEADVKALVAAGRFVILVFLREILSARDLGGRSFSGKSWGVILPRCWGWEVALAGA